MRVSIAINHTNESLSVRETPLCYIYDYFISAGFPFRNIYTFRVSHPLKIVTLGAEIHPHKYIYLGIWDIVA